MATVNFSTEQNINISQVLIGLFVIIMAAGAFMILITNMLVSSRVSAFSQEYAANFAAQQNNPVNVSNAAQTNNAPVCEAPSDAAAQAAVLGASTTNAHTGTGSAASAGGYALTWKPGSPYLMGGSYSYHQSNSSVTNTTSTNTFISDSYNTSSWTYTNNDSRYSGNTLTDSRNSGNTVNNNQAWNNGNSVNSGNGGNTANVTNNQTWNQDNNSVNNSNNTSTVTTATDNTNNSVNNSGNSTTNAQAWNNGNSVNSGNSASATSTTNTSNTSTTNNVNNSVNDSGNTNVSDNNLLLVVADIL